MSIDLQQLRREVRAKRRSLSYTYRMHHQANIVDSIVAYAKLYQHIALYYPHDGEVDLRDSTSGLWAQHKQLYLPCCSQEAAYLRFAPFTADTLLLPDQFDIPIPQINEQDYCLPSDMQLVFMPLVAVDLQGHRLGMGKGFYDRSFAFCKQDLPEQEFEKSPPHLVGVAWQCQVLPSLNSANWDVPLDALITENGIHLF